VTDPHEPRDPFEQLARPIEPQAPRPGFTRELRAHLVAELGHEGADVPTIDLPRRAAMTTTPAATAVASVATPYLAVSGGTDALDWYASAFGAEEAFRVVGDDGRLGHAEITIGTARIMLSDEYPEIGVRSPASLGGTTVTLHLEVADVDELYARAVTAGATALAEPADQAHGARHGTLLDPFGHRWMISQPLEQIDLATYAQRSEGSGFTVRPAGQGGGIWAGVSYRDAPAGIRFLVEVLGFEEQLVVTDPDDPTNVVHSEMRWPEGGVLQAGTYVADNEFMQAPGAQAVYLITADPQAVWERCQAAGVEVVRPPESPDYDPGGMGFSIRDPEGNIFSIGSYAGEA
jgi:PhnB protein